MSPSRRDELVDAAMRTFHHHGFHGTGIEQVLREAGISRMTLYYHFQSKDELIVAALRRRDEIFRKSMESFVDARATEPIGRLLAVFDFHEQWLGRDDFCGCMFINASAEFEDPKSGIRQVAADHKRAILRYLRTQCEQGTLAKPATLAEQLFILLEGAIVTARVRGQVKVGEMTPIGAARRAKQAAVILIRAAGA